MTSTDKGKRLSRRSLLGGLALLAIAPPAWAVLGVWRRTAVRTTVVVAGAEAGAASKAAASQQAAAATSAANASAAAAQQAATSANQAAAQAAAAKSTKTPQQQLEELKSLYDQKLITQDEYNASKQKILDSMSH